MAFAPLYFLLPADLPACGLRRWVLLILFFACIAAFEAYRLKKGMTFLGLRPHEKHQIASFVWAAAGITFVLWFFPHDVATAALVGCAVVDPLAGELRLARRPRETVVISCLITYILIAVCVFVVADWRLVFASALALSGGAVAVLAEMYKSPYIDDDFLMSVAPAIVMGLLALYITEHLVPAL
jgi:amino acid transporter